LYKTFDPTGFNASEWVAAARSAGMNYMVFVTKHADGFCEFNTAYTDYKITGPDCPFHRDVATELRDACPAHGMGVGFACSPSDGYVGDNRSPAYLERYTSQVVDELLTNYGRVDI